MGKNIGEETPKGISLSVLHQCEFHGYSFLKVSAGLTSAALMA
jgi:hypothetical protein